MKRHLVQVFLTPTHLAIAMEYAKGGNLFHYVLQHKPLCRLSEAKAQWIFQQLIIGLDYCHRRVSTRLSSCPCCLFEAWISICLLPDESCTMHLLGWITSSGQEVHSSQTTVKAPPAVLLKQAGRFV